MFNVTLTHQRTIVRRTEDELFMCKDPFRIEKLQSILRETFGTSENGTTSNE